MKESDKLKDLIENTKIKIKRNSFFVDNESRDLEFDANFQIQPRDFLEYAKKDFLQGDERGKVNAISNIKKAIDAQIDRVIEFLGYDYKKFDQDKMLIEQINQLQLDAGRKNVEPFKLNFINALDMVPVKLVREIREVRNELKHEYIMPNKLEIEKSLEIAELFINNTNYKMFSIFLQDYNVTNEYKENKPKIPIPFLSVMYESVEGIFKLRYYDNDFESGDILITNKDEEYIFLVKASISHDMYYLARIFSKCIPKDKVHFKIIK